MTPALTHLGAQGEANMVDVGDKAETTRTAIAEGFVSMQPETLKMILDGDAKKGDVLGTARIAGIMAAKKTHELIPLCHPLLLTKVSVDIEADRDAARPEGHGAGARHRQDRRRDGGVDRGLGCLPDHLRHGQGGRPRHGDLRRQAGRKDRRQVRRLQIRRTSAVAGDGAGSGCRGTRAPA